MSFLRHEQIYQSDVLFFCQGRRSSRFAPGLIVLMSLPPAIPWRVALQHCLPPLHRLVSMLHPNSRTSQARMNRQREFSIGEIHFSELDTKKFLPKLRSVRYNNSCPGFGPLAGFEVIMSGRF